MGEPPAPYYKKNRSNQRVIEALCQTAGGMFGEGVLVEKLPNHG